MRAAASLVRTRIQRIELGEDLPRCRGRPRRRRGHRELGAVPAARGSGGHYAGLEAGASVKGAIVGRDHLLAAGAEPSER
jgi:hypothetical protein